MSDPHLGDVETERIRELRAAFGRASRGEPSRIKARAGLEDGVLRALLHFRAEMSDELRQHISTRLAALEAEFIADLKSLPLQCNAGGANRPKPAAPRQRACECGFTHAGECW